MSTIDEALKILGDVPPGRHAMIDDAIVPKIKELIGKPQEEQATGLKSILDECAFGGLASDFAMFAMDTIWRIACEPQK